MRYVQYQQGQTTRPGIYFDWRIIDLRELPPFKENRDAFPSLLAFIEGGKFAWDQAAGWISSADRARIEELAIDQSKVCLDAPLRDAKKLILLAGNYREHIREVGYRVPERAESVTPQFFMKPPSTTVTGPGQPVILPRIRVSVDWEVELGVVIGTRGRYIPEAEALDYVFGYTIINDISERAFNSKIKERRLREKDPFMDWLHGKWFDSFAPMGPSVVTPDEIPDPHNLKISLQHNGVIEQDSNTSQMIHKVPYLIHKLSQIVTLEPGDVIATGTPSGVGHSKGICLEDGDILRCEIEGIGVLTNPVRAEE
jgi:2-keto-4-pentenoate hydratase/2-oxohepta-3-ene-1,7-dioic acid hydratase in catechol pathway